MAPVSIDAGMGVRDTIPILASVAGLARDYDAWLCDIWGVVHNGVSPSADAAEACARYRGEGGTVVLISNSPRPNGAVARQLREIGVPGKTYDAIVTSGDTTRRVLNERKGQKLFHLGPERDRALFEGLDIRQAGLEDADYVLCSGLYDDTTETPDDYAGLLAQMQARDLPMICANPDLQVERGERLIYCAGALAVAYEALGGKTVYTGKPHAPIYDLALKIVTEKRGREVERSRILCIGDGLRTDMAGAARAGLDALFVASALHVEHANAESSLDSAVLDKLFAGGEVKPVAAQERLKW